MKSANEPVTTAINQSNERILNKPNGITYSPNKDYSSNTGAFSAKTIKVNSE